MNHVIEINASRSRSGGEIAHLIEIITTFKLKTLGIRHGEKLYETLVTREEMSKSIDMGIYFRIPADNRDLNYVKFFAMGEKKFQQFKTIIDTILQD